MPTNSTNKQHKDEIPRESGYASAQALCEFADTVHASGFRFQSAAQDERNISTKSLHAWASDPDV